MFVSSPAKHSGHLQDNRTAVLFTQELSRVPTARTAASLTMQASVSLGRKLFYDDSNGWHHRRGHHGQWHCTGLCGVGHQCGDGGYFGRGRAKGLATVAGSLDRLIKKEKISEADKAAALARIKTSTSYDDLKAAQLVIEAATENYELKLKILKQVDAIVAPEVIVASNTSSISITKLAAATSRADRFIGMHFFNPVPMMALVEIIRGLQTSDATHDAVKALAEALGKSPITVKNAPGFVVNRILVPMINEAFFVLAEGLATPEDIDAA